MDCLNMVGSGALRIFLAATVIAAPMPLLAQDVGPPQDYRRFLTAAQAVTPVSSLGDQVNLRNGALSFKQLDIELKGQGPDIRILRTFNVGARQLVYVDTSGSRMGEWELALPRLKTLASARTFAVSNNSPRGWQVGLASDARCTQMGPPGDVVPLKADPIRTEYWWAGYQLIDDSGNQEDVLLRWGSDDTPGPAYVARTKSNWIITCLPTTSNGMPGEAFQATSPDGIRYWLDYLSYQDAPGIGASGAGSLTRSYASMLVTRAEDRFGNWVKYQYSSGILSGISSSDGRSIVLTNDGTNITSATVQSGSGNQVWTYGYTNGSLSSAVSPDGSKWSFAMADLFRGDIGDAEITGNCSTQNAVGGLSGAVKTGSITGPSGATGVYSVQVLHGGRSYVPKFCWGYTLADISFVDIPRDTWSYAITSKVVSGPGLVPSVWSYSYSPGNSSWEADCAAGCTSTVWTEETHPDGTRRRTTFSNKYGETENLKLKEEFFANSATSAMRVVDYTYAISPMIESNSPYPWRSVGQDQSFRTNTRISERWTPVQSIRIRQDGMEFSSVVNAYDRFARPLSVSKASSVIP